MGARNRDLVIEALVDVGRPEILKGWGRNSCAVSARVVESTCRHFGVPGRVIPVGFSAFNAEALALFQDAVPVGDWPESAWSVGVDPKESPGHVVVIVDRNVLVDLAADQFDRPAKRLRVPGPIVTNVTRRFVDRGERTVLVSQDGTCVIYEHAGSKDWLQRSPDWYERRRSNPIIAKLVEEIRERGK